MRKRFLNKNLLFLSISDLVAMIIFLICWNVMKNIHIVAMEDMRMSIIFFITLLISCTCYVGIIFITIEIIDILSANKKKK